MKGRTQQESERTREAPAGRRRRWWWRGGGGGGAVERRGGTLADPKGGATFPARLYFFSFLFLPLFFHTRLSWRLFRHDRVLPATFFFFLFKY